MDRRIRAIREKMDKEKVELFLGTNPVTRRYLTNFTGSAGVVWLTHEQAALITDFRYVEQATHQCPQWEIIKHDGLEELLKDMIKTKDIRRIAIEAEDLTVKQFQEWEEKLNAVLVPVTGWVQDLRIIKSPEEIDSIRQAATLADQAFSHVLPLIKPGVRELDIALELEFHMRKNGASGVSFDPIVAGGERSALPHARPGDRQFQHGDFIVMDFGCVYNGYCSDMTRTVVVGEPTKRHREIYDLVLKAQLAGLDGVKVGRIGREVHEIASQIISDGGFGEYFGHGLGHGVGLEIHEAPRLAKTGEIQLESGMIVTVEPGIYIPGFGGVRIEDLVVVQADGIEILSSTSKELFVVE